MTNRHIHGEARRELGVGPAITYLRENDKGRFIVGNGEYESEVAFCPWCGARAPTSPGEDEEYVRQTDHESPADHNETESK